MPVRNKKYRKKGEQRFVKCLIRIIIALIVLMLILVVHDRYAFHKQVYDNAITEINAHKKAYADSAALDSLNRRGLFVDTISKPVQISASSSDLRNHNEIKQTVNINSNIDPIKQIAEDVYSTIDTLKDTDGLISANGITYLISLIVALLIALVSDRVIAMENLMRNLTDKKADMEKNIQIQISQLDKIIEEKTQQKLNSRITMFSTHTTNYNNILNRIETIYNHTILIDNTISSAGINEKTPALIGLLSSRINLIYDDIIARFNDNKRRLDFITSDEKLLLGTYLEDALLCLKDTLNTVNNNKALLKMVEDKIYLVEEIRDKIDAIKMAQEDIYTS